MNDKRNLIARDARPSLSGLNDALLGNETGVVVNEDGTLTAGVYKLTTTGIRPTRRPANESDWLQLGAALRTLHKSLAWIAGDWLAQGLGTFGRTVDDLAAVLDVDAGTIHNWTSVARAVEFSRRRDTLSYSHHVEVAKFEDPADQNQWLDLAERNGWSSKELRAHIKDQPLKLTAAPLLNDDALAALDVIRKLTSDRLARMTKPAQLRGLIDQAEAARKATEAMMQLLTERLAEVEGRA
jgi:hypothetical protein